MVDPVTGPPWLLEDSLRKVIATEGGWAPSGCKDR